MAISWIRVNGSRQEELDLREEKYKRSDESRLLINDVRKEDEAGYKAVISREEKVKIYSNEVVLRGFGGILLQLMKKVSFSLSHFVNIIKRYHALILFLLIVYSCAKNAIKINMLKFHIFSSLFLSPNGKPQFFIFFIARNNILYVVVFS